jgi:hypothetical protein
MFRLKSIFRNITLLNAALLISSIVGAHYLFSPFQLHVVNVLPSVKECLPYDHEATSFESRLPSPADYGIISEENLFHPERKLPAEKKAEAAPLPRPDLVLYGTLVTGDMSLAYVEDLKDPRTTAGRGKRQIALKRGDMLSGFVLKEIDPDRIVMVRGDEKLTISVHDSHGHTVKAPVAAQKRGGPAGSSSALEQLREQYRRQKEMEARRSGLIPENPEEQSIVNMIETGR